MWLRLLCVGVVATACAETGDPLFRKLPDAAVPDGGISVDAAVDAPVDAPEGEVDAGEPDADLGIVDALGDSALLVVEPETPLR